MRTRTSADVVGVAGLSRYRTSYMYDVPERAWSEFAKSQLQLLSPSALPQTSNLCNGLFGLMCVGWGICMSSPAKTVCALGFKFAIQRAQGLGHPLSHENGDFCPKI